MQRLYGLTLFLMGVLCLNGCALREFIAPPIPVHKLTYKPSRGSVTVSGFKTEIEITYLGASGFLIRRDRFAILLAPFFSNPSLLKLAGPIYPNRARIDTGLAGFSLSHIKAILVGHAHYDHLMDVPYVVKKIKAENGSEPRIYGSKTMRNILLNPKRQQREMDAGREDALDATSIVPLNEKAAESKAPGAWVCFDESGETECETKDTIYRFMAIKSEHAPHVAGLKFYKGRVESPEGKPATVAGDWKEGQTLAYVMDFLGPDGTIDMRIHFQDATSNPPAGFLPELEEEDRTERVDIAILCVAGFGEVENYPEGIVKNLNPRHVILSHWENFFNPLPLAWSDLEVIRGTDADAFIRRLKSALPAHTDWTFPSPGTVISFEGTH